METELIDYLRALELKEAATDITLGGRSYHVRRGRLRRNYALQEALSLCQPGPSLTDAVISYVALAAQLPERDVGEASAAEVGAAFQSLSELNRFRGTLAVLWSSGSPKPRPEDYPHRSLSSIVTRLARTYGWSDDHILEDLGPEEAICYLQEAEVLEHEERRFDWSLSEKSTPYKSQRPEFPPIKWGLPPWEKRRRRKAQRVVPEQLRPIGVVIDFSKRERRKRNDDRDAGGDDAPHGKNRTA